MASAKESLRNKVDQLSEHEAQQILGIIAMKRSEQSLETADSLTRETVAEGCAGKLAFRVPPATSTPPHKRKRIQCQGTPASELLIDDRR